MPIYLYRNKHTNEVREIFQDMNSVHEYHGENGKEDFWQRVYTTSFLHTDASIDPFNAKDFMKKTADKKGTIGDIMDKSAELSEKRAQIAGEDPIKKKYFENYSRERKGAKHPKEQTSYEDKYVKVDFS